MNVYAYSKVAAETKMREARERGLCTNVLRFSNVFGSPFDHADRVIPAFCRAALLERPLYVEGSKNMFDFTFVDDVVEGIHRMIHSLLESPQNFSSIHLTTGRGITLEEAAHIIKNQANSKSALVEKPSRSFDVAHFYGNPKRAKDLLGWQASFSFETAIETFLPLVQKQLEREGLFLNKVAS
jgi:nucleoside-diphosphate-sugar epimerase